MEKWSISNWADSRKLVLTLRRPRGMVSIISRFGGDLVGSANIPIGSAETALRAIDMLAGRWMAMPCSTLEARYRLKRQSGDYQVLHLDLDGVSEKGEPIRLGIWLTEAPSLSARLTQALEMLLHR